MNNSVISEEDDKDTYENSYYHFVSELEVLAASPEESCQLFGHFNVAFEIKFHLEVADYLFNYGSCNLSSEQRIAIIDLIESFNTVPPAVLEYTEAPSISLRNMEHPCWIPLRKKAQNLLKLLTPNTEQNLLYFYGDNI